MSAVLCLLAVVASALCSGLETGLYCTSRLRIVLDAAGGRPAARRLQSLLTELPLVLTVLLVGNNVATWAASYLVQAELERHGVEGAEALGAIGVTVVLFVFGESVPKNLFRARQHELLYPLTPVLVALRVALGWLVWPIVAFARLLSDRVVRKRTALPPRLVPDAGAGAGAGRGLQPGAPFRAATGAEAGLPGDAGAGAASGTDAGVQAGAEAGLAAGAGTGAALGVEGAGAPEVVPPGAPAGGTVDRESLLVAGAAEGLLTGFQQRVARGVLLMRSRTAADEARPVADHPLARLGVPGVALPPDCREHRVLVLEEDGQRVAGWMPLAALASGTGFRAALRSELRPVARIAPETSLDRVYLTLDRTGTPFAAVGERAPLRVVDGRRLRQRVMGVAEA